MTFTKCLIYCFIDFFLPVLFITLQHNNITQIHITIKQYFILLILCDYVMLMHNSVVTIILIQLCYYHAATQTHITIKRYSTLLILCVYVML